MTSIPNVLAERYATPPMKTIWSAEGKIVLEREFWIAVMKGQRDLGIDIPAEAIEAYESVKAKVDLDSIMARERVTRHDVKARIEEFFELAGHEHIHKGMTSRDLTENVEQLQIFGSLVEVIALERQRRALPSAPDEARSRWNAELRVALARASEPVRHAEAYPASDEAGRNAARVNFLALVFCLMLGTAALPHVLMRYYTTTTVTAARSSVFWSLLFIFALYLAAPAYAVLATSRHVKVTTSSTMAVMSVSINTM